MCGRKSRVEFGVWYGVGIRCDNDDDCNVRVSNDSGESETKLIDRSGNCGGRDAFDVRCCGCCRNVDVLPERLSQP